MRVATLQRRCVRMIVIKGDSISQAEALAMSGIENAIIEDLIHDCDMVEEEIDIAVQTFDTYQQLGALLNTGSDDETRHT